MVSLSLSPRFAGGMSARPTNRATVAREGALEREQDYVLVNQDPDQLISPQRKLASRDSRESRDGRKDDTKGVGDGHRTRTQKEAMLSCQASEKKTALCSPGKFISTFGGSKKFTRFRDLLPRSALLLRVMLARKMCERGGPRARPSWLRATGVFVFVYLFLFLHCCRIHPDPSLSRSIACCR